MRTGDVLGGRYRLDERISAGGMGTVWRGHDDRLRRPVAVKVLHPNLTVKGKFRQRFHIEARAIAALNSPGIVDVYDFGEETTPDGLVVYIVMQLVNGQSVSAVLRETGSLSPEDTMALLAACADALSVAHTNGIVHRDIKPGNVLVDSRRRVKIVDFGIARTLGQDGITTAGMVMGTMSYVAPELLRGDDPSPAGDIYSLGVLGYQCLAGHTPFDSSDPAAILAAAVSQDPPPLPDHVPAPISAIIMRALAKRPEHRWPDAAALASACRNPGTVDLSFRPNASDAASTGNGHRFLRRLVWTAVLLAVAVMGVAIVAALS